MILNVGCAALAAVTAGITLGRASFHESLKPACALQPAQKSMSVSPKFALAIQLRTLLEPRKEMTMRELVVSTATKPVASVEMVLGGSVSGGRFLICCGWRGTGGEGKVIYVLFELG